ncbi:hypothetical protein A9Q98_08650 [Thalassotalea sp. 42_200_T64]|nr:hypothetical protein A9Q98_08650 [Thalassotalea sp. 42_200_T64]
MYKQLLLIVLSVCFLQSKSAQSANIVFDEGHKQAFLYQQQGQLGLSGFADTLVAADNQVSASSDVIHPRALAKVDALIISGPFQAFSLQERQVLADYVKSGGKLVIMIHIAPTVGGLLAEFDIGVSNYSINEHQAMLANKPKDFSVSRLVPHWLFNNVQHFNLYGGWALQTKDKSASALAITSADAWLDLNKNKQQDGGDYQSTFAVIIHKKIGKGDVLVFADDAIFQNKFLTGNNQQMAVNIANWLAKTKPANSI